jgi:hypothetical protein
MQAPQQIMGGGGGAMGGGGMPMPGGGGPPGGGGGRGFFGRLGQAMTQPFQAPPPIPENAGVYQGLQQMQQQGQAAVQKQQFMAQLLQTLAKAPTDSDEFLQAAVRGQVMGITNGLPAFLADEVALGKMAKQLGISPEELAGRASAIEATKLMAGLAEKGIAPDNLSEIMKSVNGGKAPDASLFAIKQTAEPLVDPKESYKFWRAQLPEASSQVWAALSAFEAAGDQDSVDSLLETFGPTIAIAEQKRATKSEQRSDAASARDKERLDMARTQHETQQSKEGGRINQDRRESMASYYWALARAREKRGEMKGADVMEEAVRLMNEQAGGRVLDPLDILDIESIIRRKARGGVLELSVPGGGAAGQQPQSSEGGGLFGR